MDVTYLVFGDIQLFKRNYYHVLQGCLVQGNQKVVGNVELLHVVVKPAIQFTIISAIGRFVLHKILMSTAFLSIALVQIHMSVVRSEMVLNVETGVIGIAHVLVWNLLG
jgi:hypothetical protein